MWGKHPATTREKRSKKAESDSAAVMSVWVDFMNEISLQP